MAVPTNYVNYFGKLKFSGQVIRFGGDTIFDGSTTSDLLIGVPILLPANVDLQEEDSTETTTDEDNSSQS